jgi:hypothetical protein
MITLLQMMTRTTASGTASGMPVTEEEEEKYDSTTEIQDKPSSFMVLDHGLDRYLLAILQQSA